MKKIVIHGKTLELYDSIDELPIINFQKYNKYLMLDAGIGSTVDDIDAHIGKVAKFVKRGDTKNALLELQNMRQSMYMINEAISPKYMAFTTLIKTIDGKELTDLSDDNLKSILKDISHIKHSFVADLLSRIKKKISEELELYFPVLFDNPKEKETYDKLKVRTCLILEEISKGVDNSESINSIDELIFSEYKPKLFIGPESAEIKYDKQFETTCLLISEQLNVDPKQMTVVQFYNAVECIKKRADKEAKMSNNLKK